MNRPAAPKTNVRHDFFTAALFFIIVMDLLLFVAITIASLAGVDFRWFGHNFGDNSGSLVFPLSVVAIGLANPLFRRLGLVEPSRVEALRRDPRAEAPSPMEAMELRTSQSLWTGLGIVLLTCGIFTGLLVAVNTHSGTLVYDRAVTRAIAPSSVLGLMGLIVAGLGRVPYASFIARVDTDGITAWKGLRRRTVPWRDIAACKVVTNQPVGKMSASSVYTLLDAGDGQLMKLAPQFAPNPDLARFDRAVRAAFSDGSHTGGEAKRSGDGAEPHPDEDAALQ